MLSIAETIFAVLCFTTNAHFVISAYILVSSALINICTFKLNGKTNILFPILSIVLFEAIGNIFFSTLMVFYKLLNITYPDNIGNIITHMFCLVYWMVLLHLILKKFADSTYIKSTSFFIFITIIAFFNSSLNTVFITCIYSSDIFKDLNMHTVQICMIIFAFALIAELTYIIYIYYEKTHYSIVTNFTKEYLEIEKKHFEELKEKEEDTRRFRHDINAHLSTISAYLNNQNYETLHKYMNSINKQFATLKPAYTTGSTIVDSTLNSKADTFTDNNIKVNIDGNLAILNRIDDFDVCTIFSNAISNAIEANCTIEDCAKRWINIKVRSTEKYVALEFSNPVTKNVTIKRNHVKTSKADKKNHGYGLIQIEQVIKNHDGYYKIECINQIFYMRLQINL